MQTPTPDRKPSERSGSRLVLHPGPCGLRIRTECCGDRFDPYLTGERLRNGDSLCHGCGRVWRSQPWQLAS